jgi:hypothetical protein
MVFGERHPRHVLLTYVATKMQAYSLIVERTRRYHVPPRQRGVFCAVRSCMDCITKALIEVAGSPKRVRINLSRCRQFL